MQNRPGSDLDGLVRVWPNTSDLEAAGVPESLGPVSGRIQTARYQFITFRLGSVLPQTSQITLCKTSPDPIWFWLIVSGFGQTDPLRKQAGVQESSGPLLASAAKPIRTGCESDPACLLGVTHGRQLCRQREDFSYSRTPMTQRDGLTVTHEHQ